MSPVLVQAFAWIAVAIALFLGGFIAGVLTARYETRESAEPVSGSRLVSSQKIVSSEPDPMRVSTTVRGPIAPLCVPYNPLGRSDAALRNLE